MAASSGPQRAAVPVIYGCHRTRSLGKDARPFLQWYSGSEGSISQRGWDEGERYHAVLRVSCTMYHVPVYRVPWLTLTLMTRLMDLMGIPLGLGEGTVKVSIRGQQSRLGGPTAASEEVERSCAELSLSKCSSSIYLVFYLPL